jgi:hypothetical protein
MTVSSIYKVALYTDLCSVDLRPSQALDVFELLIQTYTRYVDSASRDAVQALGKELVQREETREHRRGITEQILDRLATEVNRVSKRPR